MLWFRAAGETDPDRQVVWMGLGHPNRWLVIVPTMMGGWERWQWVGDATFAALRRKGLIEYGRECALPAHIAREGVIFGSTVRLRSAVSS